MIPVSQERNVKHLRGNVTYPGEQRGPQLRQVAVRSTGGTLGWWWGGLASYSAMTIVWLCNTCFNPLYPPFSSLSCLFFFSKSFEQGLTQPCVLWVHTSSLGLTWAFWLLPQHKCSSPGCQTYCPAFWPGLYFCKDQSGILCLLSENVFCRHGTLQRKQNLPEKFHSSKSHLKPTKTNPGTAEEPRTPQRWLAFICV